MQVCRWWTCIKTNFGVCSAEGAANTKIGFDASPPAADLHQNQFL